MAPQGATTNVVCNSWMIAFRAVPSEYSASSTIAKLAGTDELSVSYATKVYRIRIEQFHSETDHARTLWLHSPGITGS